MKPIVKITSLSKSYKGKMKKITVLKNLNLEIEKGSFTAIIGKSGSGKSTLLNCIGGLIPFDSGSLIVNGNELSGQSEEKRSSFRLKNTGMVPQFFCLISEFTVFDNLMIPFDLNGEKRDEKYVKELMELLELQGLENRMPCELSGGQQQRVAIARALSRKPDLILADEATGNLDRESSHKVIELLRKAQKICSQTVIYATHDMELAKYADRIILIEDGKAKYYE